MKKHTSCQMAIADHIQNPTASNVSRQETDVSCAHAKAICDWKGNGIHYACLTGSGTTAPVNVYDTLSSGKNSILTARDEQ